MSPGTSASTSDGTSDRLRDRVRRSVAARVPIDAGEAAAIRQFLELFDARADPFRSDVEDDPVHVTGSAIVIGPRGVVLLKHKRLGLWLQPGGHVDPGETPWDAALREAREETGLDAVFAGDTPELVHVDVHPGGRGHTHLDLRYLVDGGAADPAPPHGESQDVEWFAWSAAIDRASDHRLRAALHALSTRAVDN